MAGAGGVTTFPCLPHGAFPALNVAAPAAASPSDTSATAAPCSGRWSCGANRGPGHGGAATARTMLWPSGVARSSLARAQTSAHERRRRMSMPRSSGACVGEVSDGSRRSLLRCSAAVGRTAGTSDNAGAVNRAAATRVACEGDCGSAGGRASLSVGHIAGGYALSPCRSRCSCCSSWSCCSCSSKCGCCSCSAPMVLASAPRGFGRSGCCWSCCACPGAPGNRNGCAPTVVTSAPCSSCCSGCACCCCRGCSCCCGICMPNTKFGGG
mmetsp:Transcript_125533/g.360892  ORF Transcript_125533/g.360892 Transcript_125533/m.360892 type:complete len:268 (-) Transcript_125533:91-894(-)